MLVPVWWCLAHYNKYTNDVLYSGWTPVIGAMVISRSVFNGIDHMLSFSCTNSFYSVGYHFLSCPSLGQVPKRELLG